MAGRAGARLQQLVIIGVNLQETAEIGGHGAEALARVIPWYQGHTK